MSNVAICIPTFNQAAFLERCVRSAIAQTVNCEIWVSDDASTDETPDVMARLAAEFPYIHYTRQPRNLGMSGNPRWVVQRPTTEFIVKLDSDDELEPEYAESLVRWMTLHPDAGYGHVAVKEIDQHGVKTRTRYLARQTGFQTADESLKASVAGYRVAANICLFRREALRSVDYYRTDLAFADDWDLAVRLADAKWGNIYVNELLASYRVWDTHAHSRARRKMAEVMGCASVFEHSVIPAFTRRSWPLQPVVRARQRLAVAQAECLFEPWFSAVERTQLKQALCTLGNSRALQRKFKWLGTPLAPLMQFPARAGTKLKSKIKAFLYPPSP